MDRSAPAGRRWPIEFGLWALVVATTLLIAYWSAFSVFAPYDDEGSWLEATRAFMGGSALYSELYAYHGPFQFELVSALYRFDLGAVTHDGARFLVIAVWVGTALAIGLAVRRTSGSTWLGLAAQLAWFWASRALVNEPGHPLMAITLLLAVAGCVGLLALPARPHIGMAALGITTGLLAMTKVNVGALMAIAILFAAAVTLPGLRSVKRVAPFLVVALPLALMAAYLDTGTWRSFAIVVAMSMGAVAIAAFEGPHERDDDGPGLPLVAIFLAAAAAAVGVCLLVLMALGSSLGDVVEGAFLRPLGHAGVFNIELPVDGRAVTWSVISLVATLTAARAQRAGAMPERVSGVARVVVGVVVLTATASVPVLTIPGDSVPLVVPCLVAGLATLPVAGEGTWARFTRTGIVSIAVLQTLHAFPVAGSQRSPATVFFVIVAALCVRDGLRELDVQASARTLVTGAAAGAVALTAVVPGLFEMSRRYYNGTPLSFAGATRLRLEAGRVEMYERLVALIKRECDAFVSLPGFYSLHTWTGIPPVNDLIINQWMPLLDSDQQASIVADLMTHRRPCAIRNQEGINFWQQGRPLERRPLVDAIEGMRRVAAVESYELRVPASR